MDSAKTATRALLLLLGFCVCSTSGLQQSAPRIRLSFKGESLDQNISHSDTDTAHMLAGMASRTAWFRYFLFWLLFLVNLSAISESLVVYMHTITCRHAHMYIHTPKHTNTHMFPLLYICKKLISCLLAKSS